MSSRRPPTVCPTAAKSMSKETTFEHDTDDEELLRATLVGLADAVARGLRHERLRGCTVTLKIRLEGFATFTRSRTLGQPTNSSEVIGATAADLLCHFERGKKKVRLLGVGVSGLVSEGAAQLALFDEGTRSKIDEAIDLVRERFGEEAIFRASSIRPRRGQGRRQPGNYKNDT